MTSSSAKDMEFLFKDAVKEVRGDPIYGSEKLYKITEECIKSLSEAKKPEYTERLLEAKPTGWNYSKLRRAAGELAKLFGKDISDAWSAAESLHISGFHEGSLTMDEVQEKSEIVATLYFLTIRELYGEEEVDQDDK